MGPRPQGGGRQWSGRLIRQVGSRDAPWPGGPRVPKRGKFPHLSQRATEARSQGSREWIRDHVKGSQKIPSPRGGKVRKGLQQERKEMAGCFYQLLSDHASIESYLAEKVKIVQSSVCWWYGSGERQSRFLRVPSLSHPEQRHVERRREGLRVEAPNAPIRQAAFQRQGGSPSGPNLSTRSGGVVTLAPPEGGETGWRRGGRARAALKCTFLLSSACISSVLSYVLP